MIIISNNRRALPGWEYFHTEELIFSTQELYVNYNCDDKQA